MVQYTFVPMTEADMALGRRWLREPHVRRWYHDDPDEVDYPEGTIRDWLEAIHGDDPTDMFVIRLDDRPIGAIQSYRVNDHPGYAAQLGPLAKPAFGVDLFIGEPDLVGKGHGPALIRAFIAPMFDRYGVDYCVIGPSKSNVSAIRSYEKAGFRYLKEYREDDAREPEHILLDIRRTDLV